MEDNIKMDLQEVRWDMDWIDLSQDRHRWGTLVNEKDFWAHKMRGIS